jgi:hypothetical protein
MAATQNNSTQAIISVSIHKTSFSGLFFAFGAGLFIPAGAIKMKRV